jgi:hypothetical protein
MYIETVRLSQYLRSVSESTRDAGTNLQLQYCTTGPFKEIYYRLPYSENVHDDRFPGDTRQTGFPAVIACSRLVSRTC